LSITRNVARNRLRSAARYIEALRRAVTGSEDAITAPGGVEERAGQAGRANRLWAAVRELRPDDREIIYLRYFLDTPVDEAAAALGIAPGTVKSRLSRALDRLRAVIERSYPDLREEFGA
jgi:RNA polymerase sigma-70 factor (ECF subfamily)